MLDTPGPFGMALAGSFVTGEETDVKILLKSNGLIPGTFDMAYNPIGEPDD